MSAAWRAFVVVVGCASCGGARGARDAAADSGPGNVDAAPDITDPVLGAKHIVPGLAWVLRR
jgi:hypothetical protein